MLLPRFIIKEMMHFEMGCLMNLSDAVTVVKGVGMRMKKAGTLGDKDCRRPDFLLSPAV